MPPTNTNTLQKRCFVIMGFGLKTDFATGRKLDLNKSYKLLIKPVVENKGLICVRADEILHSGSIDYQMYKELLSADIVIADLSTANVNAFYELGIRHALRRRTTIVISEDKLAYPFDLNHIAIKSYTHLGEAIDYEEVERFRKVLGDTIDAVIDLEDPPDSPVYSHLQELTPPLIQSKAPKPMIRWNMLFYRSNRKADENQLPGGAEPDNPTLGFLIEKGEATLQARDYVGAKILFETAIKMVNEDSINDPYLIQRLAFATYKAKMPDVITALKDAIGLLSKLDIVHTNDTETVSLAGRIEKKLFEKGQGEQHLSNTIQLYERCYFLLHNRYHGVNLAFLLNKRADSSIFNTNEDKIADMIWANRIRRQVLKMCEKDWDEMVDRKTRMAVKMSSMDAVNPIMDFKEMDDNEEMFWILVNKAECHYGLGEMEEFKVWLEKAKEVEHAGWMMKAYDDQHDQLSDLMKKHGHLLNPAWKGE